jgi:multidrug resistance efflux pump
MMDKRYLAVLTLVIVSVVVAYSVYRWSSSGANGEAGVSDTTPPITPSSPGPASSVETTNETNRSSISIPLEKPPFIE